MIKFKVIRDTESNQKAVEEPVPTPSPGIAVSRNLKRRWWCYDCKLYFLAYDDKHEADIASKVMKKFSQT
ncbi:MAG TPA: hypothetical protein VE223_05910 [Nitrososphaeraceae archaeon]|nr:hypothetical protein [Nitrososphaeraceae archaeon]